MNSSTATIGFLVAACLAGMLSSMQPGMNARLGQVAGSPLWGGLVNFVIGCALIALVVVVLRFAAGDAMGSLPTTSKMAAAPWWAWLGGLLGATYVCTAIFVVPKVGGVNYFMCVVVGQIIGHAIIDRYGLLGLPAHSLTPVRVVGIVLVVGGMLLVTSGSKPVAKAGGSVPQMEPQSARGGRG
jgi:bacterial/archaeal transporter family-2 protein